MRKIKLLGLYDHPGGIVRRLKMNRAAVPSTQIAIEKLQIQNLIKAKDDATERYERLIFDFSQLETSNTTSQQAHLNSNNALSHFAVAQAPVALPTIPTSQQYVPGPPKGCSPPTPDIPDSNTVLLHLHSCSSAISRLASTINAASLQLSMTQTFDATSVSDSYVSLQNAVEALLRQHATYDPPPVSDGRMSPTTTAIIPWPEEVPNRASSRSQSIMTMRPLRASWLLEPSPPSNSEAAHVDAPPACINFDSVPQDLHPDPQHAISINADPRPSNPVQELELGSSYTHPAPTLANLSPGLPAPFLPRLDIADVGYAQHQRPDDIWAAPNPTPSNLRSNYGQNLSSLDVEAFPSLSESQVEMPQQPNAMSNNNSPTSAPVIVRQKMKKQRHEEDNAEHDPIALDFADRGNDTAQRADFQFDNFLGETTQDWSFDFKEVGRDDQSAVGSKQSRQHRSTPDMYPYQDATHNPRRCRSRKTRPCWPSYGTWAACRPWPA